LKQTAIRIPEDLVSEIELVARIQDVSTNSLIIEAVRSFLKTVVSDPEFEQKARFIMANENELLERLIDKRKSRPQN